MAKNNGEEGSNLETAVFHHVNFWNLYVKHKTRNHSAGGFRLIRAE
jgi:hypothetical protein